MKTYNISITEEELELLICGLSAQIQEFCCSAKEEEPFNTLLDKLSGLRG